MAEPLPGLPSPAAGPLTWVASWNGPIQLFCARRQQLAALLRWR